MEKRRNITKKRSDFACLFDLDGVILNTEHYYTELWHKEGLKYLPHIKNFEMKIKGHSLTDIYREYFNEDKLLQTTIREDIDVMEKNMKYDYIAGIEQFLEQLKQHSIALCLVTSSLNTKMDNVFKEHKELRSYFSHIITGEDVKYSKPNPECYLLGASKLGFEPKDCVVFEDSLAGLSSASNANMNVIALSTTQTIEEIQQVKNVRKIIDDFTSITIDDIKQVLAK
ncbi:MAG: HAD family phosphatase [Bacteroidales bacterium]|nr:HAD family phosphatase [Bacteroidales bacterium]